MDLREITKVAVAKLDSADVGDALAILEPVRRALKERGLEPGCHVGREDMSDDEVVEWFAGQGVSIADTGSWFAMNSWLNCADKFLGGTGRA